MKEIRFSGRTPSPEELTIGMETDSNAETLRFYLPEIADGQIATVQMILPDGVPEAIEIINGEVLIPARIMEVQGTARAWVEILAGDVMAWHSEMILLGIHALPEISDRTEQEYPTAFQDAIAQTLGNRQAAEAAAAAAMAVSGGSVLHFEIEDGHLILYCTEDIPFTFALEEGRLILYAIS